MKLQALLAAAGLLSGHSLATSSDFERRLISRSSEGGGAHQHILATRGDDPDSSPQITRNRLQDSVTSWIGGESDILGLLPSKWCEAKPHWDVNPVDEPHLRQEIEQGLGLITADIKLDLDLGGGDLLDLNGKASIGKRATAAQTRDADLAKLVNPFIGTGATSNPGNVFPGASVPFGMAKAGVDIDTYAPAGYNDDASSPVRGLSLVHDSGTGSSSGSFGIFESMPVVCSTDDINLCPTSLDARKRNRTEGRDRASPGYFTTTLDNQIQLEVTSTRRAGLLRYTWPDQSLKNGGGKNPTVVFDWTNDLPGTFRGGQAEIDPKAGRIKLDGSWASSFGVGKYTYRAFACYDLLNGGKQKISKTAAWQANRYATDAKVENMLKMSLPREDLNTALQTGYLVSFDQANSVPNGKQVLIRFGVSYQSADQACRNAEQEVPVWDFDKVVGESRAAWNKKLNRYQVDKATDKTIAELLYSSLYRSWLSPNNATGEGPGVYKDSKFWFDGLYCSWDTQRTFYSLLSLSSTRDYAEIAYTYLDSYHKEGFIPECRANLVPGLTQGGSNGVNIIADFALKYRPLGLDKELGVSADDIYEAVLNDGETTPPEWNSYGRQIDSYVKYGYVPFGELKADGTIGRATREASRTLEYTFNDHAIAMTASLLGKKDVAERYFKRAAWYKNIFDKDRESLGHKGFVGKRKPDGTFVRDATTDPIACSPIDKQQGRSCSLQQETSTGTYETSPWEYTLYAPQDGAGLVKMLGGPKAFGDRVDAFFANGLYYSGNEPSFGTPTLYHYINEPARSVDRVREVVFTNFNTTNGGLPGNDDNAAMATLLAFHLLGLYPIVSTQEYLIVSPFLPSYTIHNDMLGDLTVQATGFDPSSLAAKIPKGARAYVESVWVNGKRAKSNCKIRFDTLFPGKGAHTKVELRMTADRNVKCGDDDSALPSSLSTGGFEKP